MTESSMGSQLQRLVGLAEAGRDDEVRRAMLGWNARELVAAQDARGLWPGITRVEGSGIGAAWLLGLSRDGRCREAAVVRMSADPSPLTDRILGLLLADHVGPIRDRAWHVASARFQPRCAATVLPVLVALKARRSGAAALERYCSLIEAELGVDAWQLAWLSDDVATRVWAVDRWLASDPPLAEILTRLHTEPEQRVASRYVRHLARTAHSADAEALLASTAPRVRVIGVWLAQDPTAAGVDALLADRSRAVRRAAQRRLSADGTDVADFYRRWWRSDRAPRALKGMAETGAQLDRAEVVELIRADAQETAASAVGLLGSGALQGDDVALLGELLSRPRLAAPASGVLRRSGWDFDALAPLWADAGPSLRMRLTRVLGSRPGWDRVRAGLLATADPELRATGVDLLKSATALNSPHRREPTPRQRADLESLLPAAELPLPLRQAIEERLGLPVSQAPAPSERWGEVHAALLLALAGTGRLLRPSLQLIAARRSTAFALGRQVGVDEVESAAWDLARVGLLVPPRVDDLALTAHGRAIVKGLRAHAPGAVDAALARLRDFAPGR